MTKTLTVHNVNRDQAQRLFDAYLTDGYRVESSIDGGRSIRMTKVVNYRVVTVEINVV